MKSFSMLFLVSVLLGFTGCTDTTQPLQTSRQPRPPASQKQPTGIIGWWNWVESNGGMGGKGTPETEGYTRKKRFDVDGMLYVYINDTLILESSYKIERDLRRPYMSDSGNVLRIYNDFTGRWISWALEFRSADTLVQTGLATDIGYVVYVRMTRHH